MVLSNYEVAAAVLIFIAICFLFVSIVIRRAEKKRWVESIANPNFLEYERKFSKRVGKAILKGKNGEKIKDKLIKAGMDDVPPERLYYVAMISAVILGSIFFWSFIMYNKYIAIAATAFTTFAGYKLPFIALNAKVDMIQKEKRQGVLAYAETIKLACDAGLTFIQAVERIPRHLPSPLSMEFKQAYDEFYDGKNKKEALQGITERVGGDEVKLLIDAIIQSDETGIPPDEILDSLISSIRDTTEQKIENIGLNAKWKNFMVSMLIQFPAYIYIVMAPAIVALGEALA